LSLIAATQGHEQQEVNEMPTNESEEMEGMICDASATAISSISSCCSDSEDIGSRLERIEETEFARSLLKSIEISSAVVVLSKGSFCQCKSFESVTFGSVRGVKANTTATSAFQGLKSEGR
jgi:hypothetical protein